MARGIRDNERNARAEVIVVEEGSEPSKLTDVSPILWLLSYFAFGFPVLNIYTASPEFGHTLSFNVLVFFIIILTALYIVDTY